MSSKPAAAARGSSQPLKLLCSSEDLGNRLGWGVGLYFNCLSWCADSLTRRHLATVTGQSSRVTNKPRTYICEHHHHHNVKHLVYVLPYGGIGCSKQGFAEGVSCLYSLQVEDQLGAHAPICGKPHADG
jgi:hypothetical protein